MRMLISVEEAVQEIITHCRRLERREVSILQSFGYVLAEEVRAATPLPPFDRAALDGYAVRASDLAGATPEEPACLEVIEQIGAGQTASRKVGTSQAIRIMTGAPLPEGADTVVRLEATETVCEGQHQFVKVKHSFNRGEAVSRRGEDVADGQKLLSPGVRIGAEEMAVLAAAGLERVSVYRKPIIGILVSGRELSSLGAPLAPGKIYDSNGPMLAGAVSAWGGEPLLLPPTGDDRVKITTVIREALPRVDAIVTTGGVSVGDYDVMRDAYLDAGGEVHFWKVAIRPGTPFTFATIAEKPVFGLSGNPAAAFVNAMLFLRPALQVLAGYPAPRLPVVTAELAETPAMRPVALERFLRSRVYVADGCVYARPLASGQKGAIVSSLSGIEGFIRIPAKTQPQKGEKVSVYLLHFPASGKEGLE